LRGAPGVQILVTSREPLRTEGERVYRLPSLESPPAGTGISADEALRFPAVQLFVERTAAAFGEFFLNDADAPLVADICRKLDGIPLAIEFAAARVDCFGIRGLAARLDDCLRVLTTGSRTKLPRQQTMRATLDWSYGLLTDAEQTVLRRLSVFSGDFSLRAAAAVASDETRAGNQIIDQVTELVAKSLVAAEAGEDEPRLRLLETTRAFALVKLVEGGEFDAIARRHAEYLRDAARAAAQDKGVFNATAVYPTEIAGVPSATLDGEVPPTATA
jgi:predicted ATPase